MKGSYTKAKNKNTQKINENTKERNETKLKHLQFS